MAKQLFTLTCTEQIQLTPTVTETLFDLDEPLEFKAGQFLTARIPNPDPETREKRPQLRRSYSIATAPEFRSGKGLGLCVKLVEGGPGSTFIQALKPGDTMQAQAPYGHFCWRDESPRTVVFISTGTGISPFRSMIESKPFKPKKVISIHGVRHEEELLYKNVMQGEHDYDLESYWCVSRPKGEHGDFTGRVTDFLYNEAKDWDLLACDFYLCGSGDMIKELKTWLLEEKKLPKEQFFQEVYF